MVEEKKSIEDSRAEARQALLNLAKSYEKNEAMIQHAIDTYKEVIASEPESDEASTARESLLKIAQHLEKEGKKESAFLLYKQVSRELP